MKSSISARFRFVMLEVEGDNAEAAADLFADGLQQIRDAMSSGRDIDTGAQANGIGRSHVVVKHEKPRQRRRGP